MTTTKMGKTYNPAKKAAASNGKAAVMVGEVGGQLALLRYAPRAVGSYDRSEEFGELLIRAAAKIGWKKDARCNGGWRRAA